MDEPRRRVDDHGADRKAYEDALPLYRTVGDVLGEANCHEKLTDLHIACGEDSSADDRIEQAIALYRRIGNVMGEGNCQWSLGDLALAEDRATDAIAAWEAGIRLFETIGSTSSADALRSKIASLDGLEVP